MRNLIILIASGIFFGDQSIAQAPVSQIEGYLEVYHPDDTTSLYIGKKSGFLLNNNVERNNTFVGTNAGTANTIGLHNVFSGSQSGKSNSGGSLNTFVGSQSGKSNIDGNDNAFIGAFSGWANTSGWQNVFIGVSSGRSNSTGKFNTFLGYYSGHNHSIGSKNTSLGYRAGVFLNDGAGNILLGSSSGPKLIFGNFNTFLGSESGNNITRGSNNIAIGHLAGPDIPDSVQFHRLFIDNTTSSSPLIYGEFDNDLICINGRFSAKDTTKFSKPVGINIMSPKTELHIKQLSNENSNVGIRVERSGETDYWDTFIDSDNDYAFSFKNSKMSSISDNDGSYNIFSDQRLKTDIDRIPEVISKLTDIPIMSYRYKSSPNSQKSIGVIAQDVQKYFPEAVSEKDGFLAVNYDVFGVLAIKAIQELNHKMTAQDKIIEIQNERLARLEGLISVQNSGVERAK